MHLFLSAGLREPLGLFPGIGGVLTKLLIPAAVYALAIPFFWWLFRKTWKEIDDEALEYRMKLRDDGKQDYRAAIVLGIVALVLTMQEYYGGHQVFHAHIKPWLDETGRMARVLEPDSWKARIDTKFYGNLYFYAWWALTRIAGYTVIPVAIYKLIYRKDPLLDVMALRVKGISKHFKIYGLLLAIIIPTIFVIAQFPEFRGYYPFYKENLSRGQLGGCSRSWMDFMVWEALYLGQFFALEVFFRGFMLVPLRKSFGTAAVFAMCVPYVMIHFGKPYLEASTAFLAGVALGTLAMKTRSIYGGFLVHGTVAILMDSLSIFYGPGFPEVFWPR